MVRFQLKFLRILLKFIWNTKSMIINCHDKIIVWNTDKHEIINSWTGKTPCWCTNQVRFELFCLVREHCMRNVFEWSCINDFNLIIYLSFYLFSIQGIERNWQNRRFVRDFEVKICVFGDLLGPFLNKQQAVQKSLTFEFTSSCLR